MSDDNTVSISFNGVPLNGSSASFSTDITIPPTESEREYVRSIRGQSITLTLYFSRVYQRYRTRAGKIIDIRIPEHGEREN
jgi:hypothetical protein